MTSDANVLASYLHRTFQSGRRDIRRKRSRAHAFDHTRQPLSISPIVRSMYHIKSLFNSIFERLNELLVRLPNPAGDLSVQEHRGGRTAWIPCQEASYSVSRCNWRRTICNEWKATPNRKRIQAPDGGRRIRCRSREKRQKLQKARQDWLCHSPQPPLWTAVGEGQRDPTGSLAL